MLSKKAKYALQALCVLTREHGNDPVLISKISKMEGIPQKFLEAILLTLKKDGILLSKKGKGGGYSMRKEPRDVNMGHVIRLFDGPVALSPCVTYKYYERCKECPDEKTCTIRKVLKDVRDATVKILDNTTLADLAFSPALLKAASPTLATRVLKRERGKK